MKLIYGMLIIIAAQIISFIQLQGQVKWPWMRDHPYIMAVTGIPIGFMFINSTRLINDYTQATWPGRIIGQGIGIVIFALMSWILFGEQLSIKTGVCIALAVCVILIQIFWK